MATWNREELYTEVWEQPLVKVAPKYGISAVALGKVCDKLQIPLPGRGYWTKKEFGKPVERLPLPPGKDIPIVHRCKFPSLEQSMNSAAHAPKESPTDPEFLSIVALELRNTAIVNDGLRHKLLKAAARALNRVHLDHKGLLHTGYDDPRLEMQVPKGAMERGYRSLAMECRSPLLRNTETPRTVTTRSDRILVDSNNLSRL